MPTRNWTSGVLRAAVPATVLVFAPAPAVAAEAAAEPIRLAYQASVGCPEEAEFVSRVRERTARARPAWPGERARSFTVAIHIGPPPSGRIDIGALDGPRTSRSVQADTCSDVADALAMVVALAVDPTAVAPPPEGATTAPAPDSGSTSDASSRVASRVASRASPGVATRSTETRAPAETTPAPPEPGALAEVDAAEKWDAPPSEGGRFFAGLSFVVATGVAPDTVLAGSPYVGWRAKRAGWLAPSLRLAFVRAGSGPFDIATGGKASLTWTVGQADACPVASPGALVRVAACVRLEAGVLEASASDIAASETRSRPWFAAGPFFRAEWSAIGPVFVDAEAGVLFRVTDDRFFFRPDTTVYLVPLVGLDAGLGLGVRFL